jgi:hypothetical protein
MPNAIKVLRGKRGIKLNILFTSTQIAEWVVNTLHWPLFPWERRPSTTVREA